MLDDSIAVTGLAHRAMAPELDLLVDLMGGTTAMRRGGQRWLPRESNESWTAWRARFGRSVLFNGLSRTVAGRPFARPVALADAPPPLMAMATSLDGDGTPLGSFASMLLRALLIDLAWLNLAHWQSASDQRHILHVARVPILFGRALQVADGEIEIGPNRLILADDPAAGLRFVEHFGTAIAAGRQDLVDLEDRMAVLGLDMMRHHPGAPSTRHRPTSR